MTSEEKAAVIIARCATAMIRAMGMQAENQKKQRQGYIPAYDETEFERIIHEEGTHWNAIHGILFGS